MKKILAPLALVVAFVCMLASCNIQMGTPSESTAPSIEISDDGYWVINGEKTDVKAQGEKGDKGDQGEQGRGVLKVEIIDGCMWITYTDAPDIPVNVGCVASEVAPEVTTPEETIPEETAPEETAPEETAPEETAPEETAPEETNPVEKVEYTVSIKRSGGRPMPNLTFYVFEGDDLVTYGQTDANGIGKVSLKPSNNYTVEIPATSLNGYTVEERYAFVGTSASIVLQTSVIADTDLTGVRYQLGDIIRDFTYLTTDGKTFTLSEALKTKKAVLINFWYSTCGPCVNEFPYLQSAYEKYKDDIEVIALNNYPTDSEETIKKFKETMGLTFPVAKDNTGLGSAFRLQGYPTSIMIDRYGSICLIEIGGLTSEKPFVNAFEYFVADDYEQKLFESIDDIPVVQPSVGTAVGNTCPTISLDVIGSDTKFDIQKETSEGRVVVLNFWFTTCGPCLEELSSFYQVASDYSDQVSVAAVHIELPNVNVTDFIANDSGHPEWNDGTMSIAWDTGSYCTKLFKIQACPVTVVINADGVITDKFIGSLTHDELIAAVEKALGE